MKTHSANATNQAFTLVEVLVVIAIFAILLAMMVPAMDRRPMKSTIAACINNQRSIAIGEMGWAVEHNDLFPWQVSTTNGGTAELAAAGNAAPHFQAISNYLMRPKHLLCSTDEARQIATNFAGLSNENVSYFVNLGATTNSAQTILTGDRHLQVNGRAVKPGILLYPSNAAVGWTRELHRKSAKVPLGIIAFTDGHTEVVKESTTAFFQSQNLARCRLAIP